MIISFSHNKNAQKENGAVLRSGIVLLFSISFIYVLNSFLFASFVRAEEATSTISATPEELPVQTPEEQRSELERQLVEYEKQIADTEKTIGEYQKQGKTLKGEIGTLSAKIDKLNLQIKSVNLTLTKLNKEINETQRQINRNENKIDIHKDALAHAMQNLSESDQQGTLLIIFAHSRLSDFFGTVKDITLVQENVRAALLEITKLRQELLAQKEELAAEKDDKENLRTIQESQKKTVQHAQTQKNNLLKVTKGKESEYQKILVKTKESAAQIRSRIFELLGGGELTFEKEYDYARLAEGATGVRSALILAILNRESLLGKNTGRCGYKTAMHPTRDIPVFLKLLEKLNIDPNSMVARVSCANRDGQYGGAMGPAQFIPSTWKMYEADIARVTGSNPPNPWTSKDAFVATGLYLQKSGAGSKVASDEKRASAKYYCGSNWQRNACTYYASKVMETATQFEKDIQTMSGNES